MSKLYVGGLPYKMNDGDLQALFAPAGQVTSARVIMDKMTGRSRGFGFVEMASEEESSKAIEMFNNSEVDGRKIIVNEARPMEERPRREGGYNQYSNSGFGG